MNISNLQLTDFCKNQVATFECYLDVADCLPVICELSGKARGLLGAVQIIVGLGWLLRDFTSQAENRPVQNDKEVSWRLLGHGTANVVRGLVVLSSYTLIKNLAVLVYDLCLPKLFIYSQTSGHDRFIEYVPLYRTVQVYVKQFFAYIQEDVDILGMISHVRSRMAFPVLHGAGTGTLVSMVARKLASNDTAASLGVGAERLVVSARENAMGGLQAVRSLFGSPKGSPAQQEKKTPSS